MNYIGSIHSRLYTPILFVVGLGVLVLTLHNSPLQNTILLIVAFYLPGHLVLRMLPSTRKASSLSGHVGWSILISFFLVSACTLFLIIAGNNSLILTETLSNQVALILGLGLGLASHLVRPFSKPHLPRLSHWRWRQLASPILIVMVITIIPYLFNQFAQDNDGFLTKMLSYYNGSAISLNDLRPLFPAMLTFVAKIGGFSVQSAFLYTAPALFLAGILCFWSYIREEISSEKMRYIALATLSFAPVISMEMATTRPQVILLAYTIPLLLIAIKALTQQSLVYAAVGLCMSMLLMAFHELSAAFFLLFIGILGSILVTLLKTKRITQRQLLYGIIIGIPYLFLLPHRALFHQFIGVATFAKNSVDAITWEWWFIDSYISIDGAQLGWQGIQALYYYLYNGLLLYLFIIGMIFLTYRNKKSFVGTWLVPAIFGAFFFFFAEIAPRLGFTFLLNRSWPYIALASCVLSVALIKQVASSSRQIKTLLLAGAILLQVGGVIGLVQVTTNNVMEVFPEESGAIDFLADLPREALIFSTQNNRTLVQVYAKKVFVPVTPTQTADAAGLQNYLTNQYTKEISSLITVSTFTTTVTEKDGILLSEVVGPRVLVSSTQQTPDLANPSAERYFYHSKRKTQGLYAQRATQYRESDSTSNIIPLAIQNYPIVFEDEYSLIYSISQP